MLAGMRLTGGPKEEKTRRKEDIFRTNIRFHINCLKKLIHGVVIWEILHQNKIILFILGNNMNISCSRIAKFSFYLSLNDLNSKFHLKGCSLPS
jgi:hypothetical protein